VYFAADPDERVPVRLADLASETRAALECRRREVSFRAWKRVLGVPEGWESTVSHEDRRPLEADLDRLDRTNVATLGSCRASKPSRGGRSRH
jgi:hypothetical protein